MRLFTPSVIWVFNLSSFHRRPRNFRMELALNLTTEGQSPNRSWSFSCICCEIDLSTCSFLRRRYTRIQFHSHSKSGLSFSSVGLFDLLEQTDALQKICSFCACLWRLLSLSLRSMPDRPNQGEVSVRSAYLNELVEFKIQSLVFLVWQVGFV